MYIGYTPEQQALRDELRDYYAELLTPEVEDELAHGEGVGPVPARRSWQQMAADGWLGIGWPKEYGGQGRSPIEQFIFFDESMRAGAPVPMLTINTVAPDDHAVRHRGAEGLLPARRSSPARSTSASATPSPTPAPTSPSLKTRAVRDGDEYVINGQKIFTSLATDADYVLARGPHRPRASQKHKGISMIIVADGHARLQGRADPTCWASYDINATFYEDVRVPGDNLVGGENNGWKLITNQLNHERVTLCSSGHRRAARSTTCAAGRRRPSWPTAAGSSTRSGCSSTWPGCTPGSSSCASSTGRSPGGPTAGRRSTRPTRRRSRCSAPSSTSRRSGC